MNFMSYGARKSSIILLYFSFFILAECDLCLLVLLVFFSKSNYFAFSKMFMSIASSDFFSHHFSNFLCSQLKSKRLQLFFSNCRKDFSKGRVQLHILKLHRSYRLSKLSIILFLHPMLDLIDPIARDGKVI